MQNLKIERKWLRNINELDKAGLTKIVLYEFTAQWTQGTFITKFNYITIFYETFKCVKRIRC